MDLTVDPTRVYFTDYTGNAVTKIPLGGGSPATLASVASPYGIAVDATNAYVTTYVGGTVVKIPLGGGAVHDARLRAEQSPAASQSTRRACTSRTTAMRT
jgi:hypothetical protein